MTLNPLEDYDNPYWPNNVQGHAVALLDKYQNRRLDGPAIHLDLGCGFGRMAEAITAQCGVDYVGIDGADHGPASLRERGFEAHQYLFEGRDEMLAHLRGIIGERRLASMSMLDTLEHLPNGDDVLDVIRTLIAEHETHAVLSVPNLAHRDVGFKLAFGRWDYTLDGILDHTHGRMFNQATLKRVLQFSGLQIVDSNPVRISLSDQHFPVNHPAVGSGTTLNEALSYYRDIVDDTATINQFVHLVQAGSRSRSQSFLSEEEVSGEQPFLSIVTRTQGTRLNCLEEVLTALSAQDDRDFELLIVGHKLPPERQLLVERVIDDMVEWMRDRVRFVLVDEGNRTRPLNVGFEEAQGEYVAILDDDDLPFANWVSKFKELARKKPGRVLRVVAARQNVTTANVRNHKAIRSTSGYDPYPSEFDFIGHLALNNSPPVGLAFPRSAFTDFNIRFDETLTTTEDWDFLMRVAAITGVSNSTEIACIYRWWSDNDASSRSDHDQQEWMLNHETILRKFDKLPLILPPGSARRLTWPVQMASEEERIRLLSEVSGILSSWSWKFTKPMRLPAILRGRKDPTLAKCFQMNEGQLAKLLKKLQKSGSWRKTAIFRKKA